MDGQQSPGEPLPYHEPTQFMRNAHTVAQTRTHTHTWQGHHIRSQFAVQLHLRGCRGVNPQSTPRDEVAVELRLPAQMKKRKDV